MVKRWKWQRGSDDEIRFYCNSLYRGKIYLSYEFNKKEQVDMANMFIKIINQKIGEKK